MSPQQVKIGFMKKALHAKFSQHADLLAILLGTGSAKIVERNDGDAAAMLAAIADATGSTPKVLPVANFKDGVAASITDPIGGDAVPSPAMRVRGGNGMYQVLTNKTGAGAVVGIDAVAKAPPDGHTLLVTTTGTVMQNRVLYTKLPYNLDKDLVPIAVYPSGPLVLAVAPNVPARTVPEFLAWARGREGSMGSYAPGSYPQMVAGLLSLAIARGSVPRESKATQVAIGLSILSLLLALVMAPTA